MFNHPCFRRSMSVARRHFLTGLALLLVVMAPLHAEPASKASLGNDARWVATWTASPEPRWDGDFALPLNLPSSLWHQTVRQSARVSVGGERVRVMLTNEYGTRPLVIGAAHIALAGAGAAIAAGSDRTLTFNGKPSVTIPPGAPMLSDPVDLKVAALGDVSVSLYLPEPTAPASFHWDARQTTYVVAGDQVSAQTIRPDTTLTSRVFLRSILVADAASTRAVVTLGDSITDGNGSSMDANTRWPDFLAKRFAGQHVAVLNAGISGARVLRDGMGENALARFERDALSQPGVSSVIVMMGINDISWFGTPLGPKDDVPPAEALIAGYQQLIARAHLHGVRIIGATLTPFEGALEDTPMKGYYNADKERVRQAVNRWIREGGAFDAVVDFDAALRDPARPQRFLPAYDSGDHLHPGDAGYKVMADTVDLREVFGHL